MTRKEAMRQTAQEDALLSLGFTREEAESLRRISMTLHRWHELECGDGNGCIERGEDGVPYWHSATARYVDPKDPRARWRIPDRETGARKRLAAIMARVNGGKHETPLRPYIQGDPRGAALYILRPGDVLPGESVDSCYSRGLCIY